MDLKPDKNDKNNVWPLAPAKKKTWIFSGCFGYCMCTFLQYQCCISLCMYQHKKMKGNMLINKVLGSFYCWQVVVPGLCSYCLWYCLRLADMRLIHTVENNAAQPTLVNVLPQVAYKRIFPSQRLKFQGSFISNWDGRFGLLG